MKRSCIKVVTGIALLAAYTSNAASIGVQFLGRDGSSTGNPGVPALSPSQVAGVVAQPNWNSVDDAYGFTPANVGEAGPLVDSTGAATPVTIAFDANDSWYNDVNPTTITDSNAILLNGIIKAGGGAGATETFTFNNLPDATYDLYVYLTMNGDKVAAQVTDSDNLTSYYVTEWHQFTNGSPLVQATNTNPSGTYDVGNYVVFKGLGTYGRPSLGVSVTHVAGPDGAVNGDGTGVPALQLVKVGPAVPNTHTVSVTQPPASRRVLVGDTNVSFSVKTQGPVFGIQWYKNKTAIPGATGYTYLAPAISAGDNGATFYAAVSNNVNVAFSSNAIVTVGSTVISTEGIRNDFYSGAVRTDLEPPGTTPGDPTSTSYWRAIDDGGGHGNNYTDVSSGFFHPPVSGNYVFFVSADDDSDFFLSTDDTVANAHLIASETGWSNGREWTISAGGSDVTQKRSDTNPNSAWPTATGTGATITLSASKSYYFAVVHHQGGGGDPITATYKLASDPDPQNGTPSALVPPLVTSAPHPILDGGYIAFPNPPTNVTVLQSRPATFSVTAEGRYLGDDVLTQAVVYQWQTAPSGSSAFTDIPGATGNTYTTPLTKLTDSGAQYRVVAKDFGASGTSSVASVTVTPDTVPPLPTVVNSVSATLKTIVVTFNEVLDPASVANPANYVVTPGNIAGASATLDASGTVVTLVTAAPVAAGVTNTLSVAGLKDLAGNPAPAGTSIEFSAVLVTYEDDIKFDGPIAFYRFEETSGATAKNSGSSGLDGIYSVGDESGPGSGGTPGSAVGDPGPRPPAFVGFAANNRSATFDGASTWVDAATNYLQSQAAFTLEYWVSPERTNTDGTTWGNRIGIVGQNDAIEYGFIDPQTIQIWTPNGGSINTTYTFPDDEWHHVATIASGTTIKTYFDGVLQTTGGNNANGSYGTSAYNVHIGGAGVFDVTGNWFKGHIDEVAIFLKSIPADRVAAHYKAGKEGGVITTSGVVHGPGSGPATLTASIDGSTIIVSWAPSGGTLQSAPAPAGPWTDVGAANPAHISLGAGPAFYRVKN